MIGWTARMGVGAPLLHDVASPPPRYSRHGSTFRAKCGAQVRFTKDDGFRPDSDRACPACRKLS